MRLRHARRRTALTTVLVVSIAAVATAGEVQNVVLVTVDGLRTQELFGGLDLEILRSELGDRPLEASPAYRRFWADSPEERREMLLPFFWGTLMRLHGSVAGNRALGSSVKLTNQHRFSYPGYSEMLTGEARDEVIDSNDAIQNPYPGVLEFLKQELGLAAAQVAVFASWDRFNWIAEHEPGAITINAGPEPYEHPDPVVRATSRLQLELPEVMEDSRFDAFTFRLAMAHLRSYGPRVLYIAFGETDEWAHRREYQQTLDAVARTDAYLRELWYFLQSEEQYRGRTAIVITTDHGRGITPDDWGDHGRRVAEAENVWMAFVSPDSPLRGEWKASDSLYSNQVAATLARLLGLDYLGRHPHAGRPVEQLFSE